MMGSTIRLKIRWPNFDTITRQQSLTEPTNEADIIFTGAMKLLLENWRPGQPIRLIGVGVSNLQLPIKQLSLWDAPKLLQQEELNSAISNLRERYGIHSIQTGKDFRSHHSSQSQ